MSLSVEQLQHKINEAERILGRLREELVETKARFRVGVIVRILPDGKQLMRGAPSGAMPCWAPGMDGTAGREGRIVSAPVPYGSSDAVMTVFVRFGHDGAARRGPRWNYPLEALEVLPPLTPN